MFIFGVNVKNRPKVNTIIGIILMYGAIFIFSYPIVVLLYAPLLHLLETLQNNESEGEAEVRRR